MKVWLLTLISVVIVKQAQALQVSPLAHDDQLGVKISQINYPSDLGKELKSGLTTRLYIRVQLLKSASVVKESLSEVSVRYDLWDEDFIVSFVSNNREGTTHKVKSATEMLENLQSFTFESAFARPTSSDQPFKIRVDLLLNPIEKEKMEKIRKWVARNSVANPMDPTGGRTTKTTQAQGETLFNTIFEQFTKGAEVAGVWKASGESTPFTWETALHGK